MPRPPVSPPSTSSPFVSGNFDFPPASTSPPAASRSTSSFLDQLDQFRQTLGREREQERAVREAALSEFNDLWATIPDEMPSRRPRVEPPRRRPPRRTVPSEGEPRDSNSLRRVPAPPTTTNRPRATPSERYLRRSRLLREQRSTEMDLRDDSLPVPPDPLTYVPSGVSRSHSPPSELDGPRRQTKRRKLDHHTNPAPAYDGFKYGYKGQVVPGRLKMEIVSCDGGEYKEYNSQGLYKIQNVLKNDKSVYCTQSSRCNLLLKHIGDTTFSLEKVVIKAPDRGFTAPIQEGLIFVSMSSDELLSGTAGYKIEYESPSPHRSDTPSSLGEQRLSLREAVEDTYVWENSRQGREEAMEEQIERLELHNRIRANRARRREEIRSRGSQHDSSADNCEYPSQELYAVAAGVSAPTPPPFTITTESDDDSGEEEQPSAAIMADRLRRESRWRPDTDEDEDDLIYPFPPPRRAFPLDSVFETHNERQSRIGRALDSLSASRLRTPSRIEPKDILADSEGLISPHARFFIAKHKNKITIKFHPAVSGKFILLKLWSPMHDGNIDIESVQFHGYSGPRYFPAIQPC
ncbi:hypothetical protein K469DRAFT_713279 [Zopfia rhizophila CBS 207.26]|uniref:Uncharacterized protein n=1 Tax=Zopfia rhizophila CBS 207.26 TaxID=1314779 RepID=A0A6A6DS37_9PEZI|nr:hypothetical protein K469DRAFT_713279 [Zopfia rhizophila CBS 207.26]